MLAYMKKVLTRSKSTYEVPGGSGGNASASATQGLLSLERPRLGCAWRRPVVADNKTQPECRARGRRPWRKGLHPQAQPAVQPLSARGGAGGDASGGRC